MIPISKISQLKLLEIVARIPLFKPFTVKERELLLNSGAKCYKCIKGQKVQTEGEHNANFYLILSGTIRIQKSDSDKVLGVLKAGQFIGEGSFIERRPKSASAIAEQDSVVLCMDEDILNGLPAAVKDKFKTAIIVGMAERITYLNQQLASL